MKYDIFFAASLVVAGIFMGFGIFVMAFSENPNSCRKACYPAQVDVCDRHLALCAGSKIPKQHSKYGLK